MKRFAIAILMLSLLLSGCGVSNAEIPVKTDAELPQAEEQIVTAEPEALPEVEFGETVNKSGEYTDSVGNVWHYSYKLPRILGADTEYTQKINSDMDSIVTNTVDTALRSIEEGYSLIAAHVSYEYTVNDEIISLLITVYNDCDENRFYVYNFDRFGNEISNEDVIAAAGYTTGDYLTAARERLNSFYSVIGIPEDVLPYIEECRLKTIAEDNCNLDMPVYLGTDKLLCFAATTYSVAGAGSYDHLFSLHRETGYTENQLAELALSYCEYSTCYRPQYAAVQIDGMTATIQLYDLVGDHNSTTEWYTVDVVSGVGTDVMEFPVDISFR